MSGVITEDGRQFEHCQGCDGAGDDYSPRGRWVEITKLCFEEPTREFRFGRDLCSDCAAQSVAAGKAVDLIAEPVTIVLPPREGE